MLDREALLAHDEALKNEEEETTKKPDNKSNSRALIIGFAAMCLAVRVPSRGHGHPKVQIPLAQVTPPAPSLRAWGTKCSKCCNWSHCTDMRCSAT